MTVVDIEFVDDDREPHRVEVVPGDLLGYQVRLLSKTGKTLLEETCWFQSTAERLGKEMEQEFLNRED